MRMRPALTFTLAAGLAVAACQAAPTGPSVGTPAAAPAQMAPLSVRTGRVTVDGALLQAWLRPAGDRRLMDSLPAAVTKVRLSAIGPGIEVTESAEQTFSGTLGTPPSGLTLAVTPGPNRVFTLEGLDANGQVVRIMRTLGGVDAGATSNLSINAGTDAAARVLEDLLTPSLRGTTDASGIVASLGGSDLTAALTTFVTGATGFQAGTNVYTQVAPLRFRDRVLADALLTSGRGLLAGTPGATYAQAAAGATLQVKVLYQGQPLAGAVARLYVPDEDVTTSTAAGMAVFSNVPPGRWVVRVDGTAAGQVAWATVRTRDNETTAVTEIELDPELTGATPPPADTATGQTYTPPNPPGLVAPTPFPSPASLPYVVTFAGRVPSSNTANALGPVTYRPMSKVAYDANGAPYVQAYGLVLKVEANNSYKLVAKVGQDGITGIDFLAMAVAPLDATVYVANTEGKIYKCPPTGGAELLATLPGTLDLAVSAAGTTLYARGTGGVTKLDLSTNPVQTADLATITGSGPIAVDGGIVYVYSDDGHQLWKVDAGGNATVLAGSGEVGLQDGGSVAAKFVRPEGLAVAGGKVYVADAGANRIRAVDATTGAVTTVAGTIIGHYDVAAASGDTLTGQARFNHPASVAARTVGQGDVRLMVADTGNNRLREVDLAAGTVTTTNALGSWGAVQGAGSQAVMGDLYGITAAGAGELLVADDANDVVWTVATATRQVNRRYGNGLPYNEDGNGVDRGLDVDQARLASNADRSFVHVHFNSGGNRVFLNDQGGGSQFPLAPFNDVSTASGKAYGLSNGGDYFSIYELFPPAANTLKVGPLNLYGAGLFAVAGNKAYVTLSFDGPSYIEEIPLDNPANHRTVFDQDDVQGLCADPSNGHVYAISESHTAIWDIDPAATPTASILIGNQDRYATVDGPVATAGFGQIRELVAVTEGNNHYLYVTDGATVRRVQRP